MTLLYGTPATAGVSELLADTGYRVMPESGQSLLESLNAATPHFSNGQRYHAYTRWSVAWHYRWWGESDGRCRITEVDTVLTASIDLPYLVGANVAQAAEFERYLAALREHELGHVHFGRAAAEAIDAALRDQPEMVDCATLETASNALGAKILQRFRADERRYDADTGYGRTQGAWLER